MRWRGAKWRRSTWAASTPSSSSSRRENRGTSRRSSAGHGIGHLRFGSVALRRTLCRERKGEVKPPPLAATSPLPATQGEGETDGGAEDLATWLLRRGLRVPRVVGRVDVLEFDGPLTEEDDLRSAGSRVRVV